MADYKILLVFGTRPEAIKLFPLVTALRVYPQINLRICVTAQHREMLDQILAIVDIVPDIDLNIMRAEQTLDSTMVRLILALGATLDHEQPQHILVHGDTLTASAAAQAAYFRKIPIGHIEAGLRSGDMHHPWPEEGNRKIIAGLADLHFAPTARAAAALRAENIPAAQIHITGNTIVDALKITAERIVATPMLAKDLEPLVERFAGKRIITVTAHRRENFDGAMEQIAYAIADIARREDVGLIFPLHPNPQVQRVFRPILEPLANVALIAPLDYPHFVRLLTISHVILTDSGGIQEEACALGKPVLVMRKTSERREAMDVGTAKLVGSNRQQIVETVCALLDDQVAYATMAQAADVFGDGTAAAQIAAILAREI